MKQTVIAYWFSRVDGTTEHQQTPAKLGTTDTYEGEIIPCENGLHASPAPYDALRYACGPMLWEVELTQPVPHGAPIDKYAGRSRKYLRCADLMQAMREFAAKQALSVIHLWDAPPTAREYLQSIVEHCDKTELRAAAWDAARAAAKKQFNEMAIAALPTL